MLTPSFLQLKHFILHLYQPCAEVELQLQPLPVPRTKLLSLAQPVLNLVVFAWSTQWEECAHVSICAEIKC